MRVFPAKVHKAQTASQLPHTMQTEHRNSNHLAERTKLAAGLPACDAAETQLRQKDTALLSTLSFEHQTAVRAVGSSRGQGTVRDITVAENKSQVLVLTEEFAVDLGNAFVWVKEPTLRTALFWVTAQLIVVNSLPTFRDNLSVPSSRVKPRCVKTQTSAVLTFWTEFSVLSRPFSQILRDSFGTFCRSTACS
jgi:hypothetical protein